MNVWQIIWLALNFSSLGIYATRNGEPRNEKYNFKIALLTVLIEIFILSKGGFF